MKCNNCNHKIEKANSYWKKNFNKPFFHSRNWNQWRYIPEGRQRAAHLSRCFCGCEKPIPYTIKHWVKRTRKKPWVYLCNQATYAEKSEKIAKTKDKVNCKNCKLCLKKLKKKKPKKRLVSKKLLKRLFG